MSLFHVQEVKVETSYLHVILFLLFAFSLSCVLFIYFSCADSSLKVMTGMSTGARAGDRYCNVLLTKPKREFSFSTILRITVKFYHSSIGLTCFTSQLKPFEFPVWLSIYMVHNMWHAYCTIAFLLIHHSTLCHQKYKLALAS